MSTVSHDSGLHAPAFLAATGAALLGALAWAGIAYVTEYELGYVAWGIGLLVGVAAVKLGGRGVATATTCAALTLVAILGGKLLGTHLLVEKEMSTAKDDYFTQGLYDELVYDAGEYATLGDYSPQSLRVFMVEHNYGDYAGPEQVSNADLAEFQSSSVPQLERLHSDRPGFGEWQELSFQEFREGFEAEFSLASAVGESLNAIDLIFVVLAISTAFGMIRRAGQGEAEGGMLAMPVADDDETRRAA